MKAFIKRRESLAVRWFGEFPVYYRRDSSDERVINEVLVRHTYRRTRISFDVELGEHWLDLGANIGTFAVYCLLRGATADCYEPDRECYRLLTRNAPGLLRVNAAVTAARATTLSFWPRRNRKGRVSVRGECFHKGTTYCEAASGPETRVENVWAGLLRSNVYDGIKIDIEGSEFDLLDKGLLPRCEKLCVEYHSTMDKSTDNLRRRLGALKDLFQRVCYPKELDRLAALHGQSRRTFMDRTIFCLGWKGK